MDKREYEKLYLLEEKLWWFRAMRLFVSTVGGNSFKPGLRVLDIGAGTGGLGRALERMGCRVVALDYSQEALNLASREMALLTRANGNSIPFKTESFDFVISVDVLEVAGIEPTRLVSNALRVLKRGGTAIFVAAAHQWLGSEHDRAVNSVKRFTLQELKTLVKGLPVHITKATYLYFFLFPLIALRKILNRPGEDGRQAESDVAPLPQVINGALLAVCWIENQFLRLLNFPIGSSALIKVVKDG
jgi:ubiquinone/menaquinone biosynthesis C-methylase UbiE